MEEDGLAGANADLEAIQVLNLGFRVYGFRV